MKKILTTILMTTAMCAVTAAHANDIRIVGSSTVFPFGNDYN